MRPRAWLVTLLASLLVTIALVPPAAVSVVLCTPLGSATAVLQLCKPAAGETGWDAAINNNFTILDGLFNTGILLKPVNGGTGISTAASTGVPSIAAGVWSVNAVTQNGTFRGGATGSIVSTGAMTNGQVLIGSTGAAPALATITGTANQVVVTNGAGTVTLSTPQDIATTSGVQFDSTLVRIARSTQSTLPLCNDRLDVSVCTGATSAGSDTAFRFRVNPGIAAGTRTLKIQFNVPFAAAPSCVAAWNGTATYGYYVYAVAAQTTTAFISLGGANVGTTPTPSWGPHDQGSLICFGVQ